MMFGGLSTRKAFHFIKYDSYKDRHGVHFDDGSVTLLEYLNEHQLSALPIHRRAAPKYKASLLDLHGENCNVWYKRVATEEGRKFWKSLLEILWIMEQNNECFVSISSTNVYIRDGRCVLHNVERMDLDLARLKANYLMVKTIIEDGFKGFDIPEDIKHLLYLIENEYDKRSLFRNHASLWSLSERGGLYLRMHEQLKTLPVTVRDDIYCVMGRLPYIPSWRSDAKSSSPLKSIYEFDLNRYTCKNVKGQTDMENKQGILFTDFLRNRVAHRLDRFDASSAFHTAQSTELATLIRWPLAYPSLQYELYKQKTPDDFNAGEIY